MEETNIKDETLFRNSKSERIEMSQENIAQYVHLKIQKEKRINRR